MTAMLFVFGTLLALGFFFVAADVLKLPYLKTTKAMVNTGREKKKEAKTLETYFLTIAGRVAPLVQMDVYKRNRLKNTLYASGLHMEPETYQAYALVKAGAVLLCAVPCLFVFPLASILFFFLAVVVYFQEINRADELLIKKREHVEAELPRLVSTIEQELKHSRDVLSMLEHYKKNAGDALVVELDVLVADMRSSSYEAALTRFEARLNSPMLSDVVRGLIGVLRGDDGGVYFQMLSHDFKQMELQRLKKEAQKIPPKIRVFSLVMLLCFLFMYLIIIAIQIITSMGSMF